MGLYADKITPLSPSEKCKRSHSRRLVRVGYARGEAEERNNAWNALSVKDRIASLKGRPGNSKKQIARLLAA